MILPCHELLDSSPVRRRLDRLRASLTAGLRLDAESTGPPTSLVVRSKGVIGLAGIVVLLSAMVGLAALPAEAARLSTADRPDLVAIEGVLTNIAGDTGFVIDNQQQVTTDEWTSYWGIGGFDDLQVGQLVYVEGVIQGDTVLAGLIIVTTGGGDPAVIDGVVSEVLDADFFILDGITLVEISPATILDGFSHLSQLVPGDAVHVEGWWSGDTVLADLVRLDDPMGQQVSVQGYVTEVLTATDFMLDWMTPVLTDATTVLVGIQSIGDLLIDDLVAVDGVTSPSGIVASRVELLYSPGLPAQLIGIVDMVIDPNSFNLIDGTMIVTDAGTVFIGLGNVLDLVSGDLVSVDGRFEGDVFVALQLELLQTAPEPVEMIGLLAFLDPPNAFVLDDGTRVEITGETQWISIAGYEELGAGDELRVRGHFDPGSWSLIALEVELLDRPDPTWITREGWVEEVTGQLTIRLTDGVMLQVRPDAVLVLFDSITNLGPGDRLWIGAFTTPEPELLDVLRLELLERPGEVVDFVSVVEFVDLGNHRFSTANGYEIVVDYLTTFVGLDGLFELESGDWVAVIGVAGADPTFPQRVAATIVEWRDGEGGGGGGGGSGGGGLLTVVEGIVTQLDGAGAFELDYELLIDTDTQAQWRNALASYNDLVIGMPIRSEVLLHDDGTVSAIWVEGFATAEAGILELEGFVLEINIADRRLLLETGEWIEWDELTRIDGDAGDFEAIVPGMRLWAAVIDLLDGDYFAFDVFVEIEAVDVGALGFPDEPIRETLVVLAGDAIARDVAARHDAVVTGTIPGLLVHLFQWDEEIDIAALQAVLDDEDVLTLEPNRSFSDPESDPDSIRRRAIAIDRTATSDSFRNQEAVNKAGLSTAHLRSLGQGTVVAVIDTGVDPFHPILRHRVAPGGYDFVDDDPHPWETADGIDQDGDHEIDEGAGHGTFVSGLVLLAAPATSILPFRVLDDDGRGSTFNICRAVLLAVDEGADVVNMSFAYPDRSRVLDRILMEASNRGVVLVSGAGNGGLDTLPFPAIDNRVLAVAAVDGDGRLAEFSNHGDDIALGAPGVDLFSAGVDAQFGVWSGTSMAAPLVSGTVALLRSVNPYLTPAQIAAALHQGASDADPGDELNFILDAGTTMDLVPGGQ